MPTSEDAFELFTALRYDPLLLESSENSSGLFSFASPSPFYMLAYHRDRMLEAAQHFEWNRLAQRLADGKALEAELLEKVRRYQTEKGTGDGPLKVRVLFNRAAHLHVDLAPVPPVPLTTLYPPSLDPPKPPNTAASPPFQPHDSSLNSPATHVPPGWLLTLDTAPTPISPYTLLKTTHRPHYDASRTRALPSSPALPSQGQGQAPEMREVLLWNDCGEMTEGSLTSLYFYRGGRWVTPPVGVPAGHSLPKLGGTTSSETVGTNADTASASALEPIVSAPRQLSTGVKDDGEDNSDEGELRVPFPGRWGHSVRSEKVGSGGQRGTTRRWALKRGLCMEEIVLKDTVKVGEGVWVSNGVRGFGFGRMIG